MSKKILAGIGATSAALMAGSTMLSGATAFGADLNQAFALTGFLMGVGGTVIATWLTSYRANSA